MNLSRSGHSDWDVLGPTPDLSMGYISDDYGWSLILQILIISEAGKRRVPALIPLKDVIIYLRGKLGLALSPIEVAEIMASLGISVHEDLLKINVVIGVPISPEEIAKIKQALKVTLYGFPLDISMPIRTTDTLFDFVGEIWTVKKSKKRLKKIKEKLKSI